NLSGNDAGSSIDIWNIRTVAHQAACLGLDACIPDGWQVMASGENGNMAALASKESIAPDYQCAGLLLDERFKCAIEIICLAGAHNKNLQAEAARRVLDVLQLVLCFRVRRVDQNCNRRGSRHHLVQQSKALGAQAATENAQACEVAAGL